MMTENQHNRQPGRWLIATTALLLTALTCMVVYRGGDQLASWAYAGLLGLGLTLSGVAVFAVPLSVAWLGLSVWLGRQQKAASGPGKKPERQSNRLRRRGARVGAPAARFQQFK